MAKRVQPMSNKPIRQKLPEPNLDDLFNLLEGHAELCRLRDRIRALIDSDPIDLPKLELTLREAIAAVDKTLSARTDILFRGREKTAHEDALKKYDAYLKMLLAEIVGTQH
jgi:hypothetical protein